VGIDGIDDTACTQYSINPEQLKKALQRTNR
jgi:hypothetical protein